jgi:hypothetical protein
MSNDPRVIKEGGYQGTRDPGPPPQQLFGPQIVPVAPAPAAQPAGRGSPNGAPASDRPVPTSQS